MSPREYNARMDPKDLPPGVYRDGDAPAAEGDAPPVKPDWKDVVALTLAMYQVLLLPLLAIIGGVVGVLILLQWLT